MVVTLAIFRLRDGQWVTGQNLCTQLLLFSVEEEEEEEDGGYSYKDMMRRDERRWKRADKDGDGALTKQEFGDFLNPEDAEHMRDIVVEV